MTPRDHMAERRFDALRHALGEAIGAALIEPLVMEILVNPDGKLLLDVAGSGRRDTGERLAPERRDRIIRLAADHAGETVSPERPRLSASLPGGERFQAFMPPVTAGPAFSIRKRAGAVIRLDDYAASGAMSSNQVALLKAAVETRRNILVSGGTGAGKTTLANALLAEPGFSHDRVFIIEDTPELQCVAADRVEVLTRRPPHPVGVADLVRDALRMRPDRIVIGEMRDGAAALETLKAWNTGHPGGLSTLHANSAAEALDRLEDLLSEVMVASPTRLIARAVGCVVHMRRGSAGPVVEEILDLTKARTP